ncbi:MAG: lysophospholipase, partial [gamma proteobacterium symbiont of Lucinoma myriamae]|nr:lysophospholipase [gamma proteobacterium symbiont of Lucinoma myriamae]MCU7833351.1 lysophospholipase [gamma proteobacterium symbiont of Lucinoma myriamae]
MKSEELLITTEKNKKLFSWFIPTKESAPLIIIMHGWGSNAEHMLPIAATFHQAGLNALVMDSRCHGKSDGDTYSALPRFAEDINHAVDYTRENLTFNGKIILLGHSVGAGASLFAASKRNDISALISLSAFGHQQWLMTRFFNKFKLPRFLVKFLLSYIQWIIGHRFNDIAAVTSINKLSIPTLLVHGTHDKTVPIEDAYLVSPEKHIIYLKCKELSLFLSDQIDQKCY